MDKIQKNYRRNYYNSSDSGKVGIFALLGFQILGLIFFLIASSIAAAAGLDIKNLSSYVWYAVLMAFVAPLTFLLIYLLYNKFAKISYNAVNIKFNIGWKKILLSVVVGVVALLGLQLFIFCVDYVIGLTGYNAGGSIESHYGIPFDNFGWFILNLLLLGLLPAIFEEIIFRGMILSGLRKNTSDVVAVLLSALLFALMHGDLQQLVYPFLLGCILGWLVMRTGSTLTSIIAHFTNNFIVILMNYCIKINITMQWWIVFLAFITLGLTILFIFLIDYLVFKRKNAEECEKFKSRLSIFVWIALLIGLFLLIFNIVLKFKQ